MSLLKFQMYTKPWIKIETMAEKKQRSENVFQVLGKTYPHAKIALNYENNIQLLVAVILSAQCTDKKVNEITTTLFKKYKTAKDFARAKPAIFEKEIKPRRAPFISINCEAHNFMFGFMMAPEHPYAEVVEEDGSFAIKDVPPGAYTVKAWHPRFGLKEGKVTVTAKGAVDANFEFTK